MNVEEVRTNIKNLLDKKNITLREASLFIGQNEAYMHQFFSKRSPLRLPEQVRKKLALLLGVDESELTDLPIERKNITKSDDIITIDVVDVIACCGDGTVNFEENIIGQQMVTRDALRELTYVDPKNIKILRVIGESMTPTINPDDTVWVDISYKTPSSDGLYLIRIGSDLMVKRIQIHPLNNTALISSDNPKYTPIQAGPYKDVSVLGKVIYHIKKVG